MKSNPGNPQPYVAPHMSQLQADHPEWMDRYENTDIHHTNMDEAIELLQSAPNGFAAGLVYGKMSIVQAFARVSEASAKRARVLESRVEWPYAHQIAARNASAVKPAGPVATAAPSRTAAEPIRTREDSEAVYRAPYINSNFAPI